MAFINNKYKLQLFIVAIIHISIHQAQALLIHKNLEQLTEEASLIVEAQVADLQCEWDTAKIKIYTYARLEVIKALKTDEKPSHVIVKTMGGQVGEDCLYVPDAAKLEKGEHVLLFLDVEKPGLYRVVGWKQGKFTINEKNQVKRIDIDLKEFWNKIIELHCKE